MVSAVRNGGSLRSVSRRFKVSLRTVQRWVDRAGDTRLDRVDWSDHADGPHEPHNRTTAEIEDLVLDWRRKLRTESDLGEYGAAAIRHEIEATGLLSPSERTINRILDRRGVFDSQRRPRATPPPRGWYLADVADGRSELDYFDVVNGLVIEDGPEVEVLNGISLHGGLVEAWPCTSANAQFVRKCLAAHWLNWGLPTYSQFDNDTRFQGPHQHPDVVGSVTRLCLSLGVTPVFVPPREPGFQAGMESFNGMWQAKVWCRYRHTDLPALQAQSARYVGAYRTRRAARIDAAPQRRLFPDGWGFDLQAHPAGTVIYIRRTTEQRQVSLLGRCFSVDLPAHRLVRCEVLLDQDCIRFYRLRRREPYIQPLIGQASYTLPRRKYRGS